MHTFITAHCIIKSGMRADRSLARHAAFAPCQYRASVGPNSTRIGGRLVRGCAGRKRIAFLIKIVGPSWSIGANNACAKARVDGARQDRDCFRRIARKIWIRTRETGTLVWSMAQSGNGLGRAGGRRRRNDFDITRVFFPRARHTAKSEGH